MTNRRLLVSPWLVYPIMILFLALARMLVGRAESSAAGPYGSEIFVAPTGSDSNPGTKDLPFATLERARTAIRALKQSTGLPAQGIVVWLRGGIYQRTTTFTLGAEDSGEAGKPAIYRSYPGEQARLLGGKIIDRTGFTIVTSTSPAWSRVDPAARGHLMQADLAAQGITDYGKLAVRGFGTSAGAAMELFFNQAPMTLARWPDASENDEVSTYNDDVITIYGNPIPDVTGTYVKSGTQDGVNAYIRQGLVGGKQYNLHRRTWIYQSAGYTAWFLTTTPSGYPAAGDPFWSRYALGFGPLAPAQGGAGTATTIKPDAANHGFARIAEAVSDTQFTYFGSRPERWQSAPDIWFHGYWKYPWADLHVAGTINAGTKTVTLAQKPGYGIETGQSYCAENLLEEITTPGEWYVERKTGVLYFWPPSELNTSETIISTLSGSLVQLMNASYIVLQDLVVEIGRGELVRVEGGAHNVVNGCVLRNAGTTGALISGTDNGLNRCQVYATGDAGASLSGGVRSNLTPGRNYVRNCDIRNFGRWSWTYQPAVRLAGAGHIVAHNRMHDAPHSAILFSGNEHAIEYNDIHHVCQFSSDAGAVYTGRDWGYRGNSVRYNFIHDIDTWFEGYGVHGIYLDDCVSGIRVFGNILYRISGLGVHNGGGRDNMIENNVFARNGAALSGDSRGISRITNISGDSWNLLERLAADSIKYQQPPWSSAYPKLAAIPNSWAEISDPTRLWRYPQGCVFSRNIGFANSAWAKESNYGGTGTFNKYDEIKDNIEDRDPQFVDEAALDLALKPSSPAFTIPGFQPIPFRRIGLERTSSDLVVAGGGVAGVSTDGGAGPLRVGYAVTLVNSGKAPYGTAVFSFAQDGAIISETGVPASPPTTSARIFVDYGIGVSAGPERLDAAPVDIYTGFSVVNCGNSEARVIYTLRDTQAKTLAVGHGALAPGVHRAGFIHQLRDLATDFTLPASFPQTTRFGSLEISSDQPLSIVALRTTINQRGNILFATVPIADLTHQPSTSPLFFPQFVDGDGYITALILLSSTDKPQSGFLRFYADDGSPQVVRQIGGAAASMVRYSIPAGGVYLFYSDGFPSIANVGSVQLFPDPDSTTPAGAGIFSRTNDGYLVTESGIPSAAATTHARVFVDMSGGHDSGLAIAGITGTPLHVTLKAFQSDGVTPAGSQTATLNLPGNGHKAAFAGQWTSGLPANFRGVLDISAAEPFAALTLRALFNARRDFLLTTFPIADMNREAPAPLIFPQIADGGGYGTEFILLSAGGETRTTISFFAEDSTPLDVGN